MKSKIVFTIGCALVITALGISPNPEAELGIVNFTTTLTASIMFVLGLITLLASYPLLIAKW